MLLAGRLLAPDAQLPSPSARGVLAKACGYGDWEEVLPNLETARRDVADAWEKVFGEKLETAETET
jgi:glutamate-ammonia-ligase adenylyltransferase